MAFIDHRRNQHKQDRRRLRSCSRRLTEMKHPVRKHPQNEILRHVSRLAHHQVQNSIPSGDIAGNKNFKMGTIILEDSLEEKASVENR